MLYLYNLLLWLGFPLLLIRLFLRSRKNSAYRHRIRERFGLIHYPNTHQCIWIHAVSVGESEAAVPLVEALIKRYPDRDILVTTTTPTGSANVRKKLGDQVHHYYLPYDYPFAIRRFFSAFHPKVGIIMETELWPNLLKQAKQRHLPLMLANARLSERALHRYQRSKEFSRHLLEHFNTIAAQDEIIADRFRMLGANPDQLKVTGSLKFHLNLPPNLDSKAKQMKASFNKRPIWIAASTHPGEEALLIQVHQQLLKTLPDLLLILVPRHPERADEISQRLTHAALSFQKLSENKAFDPNICVLLGDTMGDLMYLYHISDAAFVGGSLVKHGGHNVIEPIALGVPTAIGPNTFNFQQIVELLSNKSLCTKVQSVYELPDIINRMLIEKQKNDVLKNKSQKILERYSHALENHLQLLEAISS